MLKLHLPVDEVAVGGDDQPSLFPHTPRLDDRCFDKKPDEGLVVECLRPGTSAALEESERDWMQKRLVGLGHAANDRNQLLMAHSWFQCAYATRGSLTELLSSTNMRLKLGQWHLCEQIYQHVLTLELTEPQMEVCERKLAEVQASIASGATNSAAGMGEANLRTRLSPDEELTEMLAAPEATGSTTLLPSAAEVGRLLALVRACGHAANRAADFEAAYTWFDCAYALSAALPDLLSAANMRAKLVPTSNAARAAYAHVLAADRSSDKERQMAQVKLAVLEQKRQEAHETPAWGVGEVGGAAPVVASPREYA